MGAQAHRARDDSRRPAFRRALAQASGDARVPPCRTVRQSVPPFYEGARVRARTTGRFRQFGARSGLVSRGRRRDGRNSDVVVRARASAVVYGRVPGLSDRGEAAVSARQVVLRVVQELYSRPLPVRLSAGGLVEGAIRRRHVVARGRLRGAASVYNPDDQMGAAQVLPDLGEPDRPLDAGRPDPLLALAARRAEQRLDSADAPDELYRLQVAHAARRLDAARAQKGHGPSEPSGGRRSGDGPGAADRMDRKRQHASGAGRQRDLLERVPQQYAVGTTGVFGGLPVRSAHRAAQDAAQERKRSLSDAASGRPAGYGRLRLYGAVSARPRRREAIPFSPHDVGTRSRLRQPDSDARFYRAGRRGNVDRSDRSRERSDPHASEAFLRQYL